MPDFDIFDINTLTEAWKRGQYGPFTTRAGLIVNIVDKRVDERGLTVYIGDNDVSYYPTGLCHSNGSYTEHDLMLKGTQVCKPADAVRVRSEARLLYFSKRLEEARRDLREYIRGAYPLGSEVSYTVGISYRDGKLIRIHDAALIVEDADSGKRRTVQFHRLLGPQIKIEED